MMNSLMDILLKLLGINTVEESLKDNTIKLDAVRANIPELNHAPGKRGVIKKL